MTELPAHPPKSNWSAGAVRAFLGGAGEPGTAALRPVDVVLIALLVLASVVLVYLALGNIVWVAGFAAGLTTVAAGALLFRRLYPVQPTTGAIAPDWALTRLAAEHDTVAVAITDRAGRLVCANDLYAGWFGGFVTPPGLPVDPRGQAALKDAGRAAWRDGTGVAAALALGPLMLDADVTRAGRADDYLVWRFRNVEIADVVHDVARALSAAPGTTAGLAGIMAALVTSEGRVKSANGAFVARATGRAETTIGGRDIAQLLRIDANGLLFFEQEGPKATPVRLLQVPLQPDNAAGPVLVLLVDEDGSAAERGAALTYIESLLSSLPFGLAMVDRDGRFLFVNKAFCRAAGVPEVKPPRYPGDIVVSEDKGPLADMIRRHSHGTAAGGDLAIRLVSQPDEPVPLRVAGVRGLGDAAVLLSLKDNSEESTLKRQVAQATKMQAVGQLAGGIAHDFNNILTAVLGSCDLMLMRHTPGDGDYDDIQQIRSNANRAASLTRQLLAFSRQQTLRPQILQLPDVVSEVSHLLKRLIGETTSLSVRHGRGLGAVRADPGQLEQVIVNLAVNAKDAMPRGGTLTIETYAVSAADVRAMGSDIMPPADYSALRVSDTGTGIPADVLPKIFEPFFTTKDVGKGTGLGLSTVYGIIKQSAGFIFAESPPKQGTCFTIYLPVHRGAGEPAAAAPAKPKKAPVEDWGTGTILLVEDEDMVRAVAERALVRAGFTVVCAANGEEGLERFGGLASVDLVVSDVVMPSMDGPAMVRELRARAPTLPILFMSGYAEEQLRKSIDIDDVGFLPKPFSVAQLVDTVNAVLAEHRAPAAG